jgi:hypothetical protein
MIQQQFNAPEILQRIRQRQAIKRRRQFRASRLTRVRAELVALRQAGGSYRELAAWLRQTHRIKITHTSIMRYLVQLPKSREVKNAELPQC